MGWGVCSARILWEDMEWNDTNRNFRSEWSLFLPPPIRRFRPDEEDGVVEVALPHKRRLWHTNPQYQNSCVYENLRIFSWALCGYILVTLIKSWHYGYYKYFVAYTNSTNIFIYMNGHEPRQYNNHKWFYTNKVGAYLVILLLFTVNAITQSFNYILFMSYVIRDRR